MLASAVLLFRLSWSAGALLISAGGSEVRIWNTLGAGQLLTKLDNFVKTVTALQVFQPRANGPLARKIGTTVHLLTGSLDGNLRVSKHAYIFYPRHFAVKQ